MVDVAIEKIRREFKECGKLSRCGAAVGGSVVEALELFCRQSREFAQAVVSCSKSVGDCIESTVRKCGASISDIEVYRRAVSFYFPGAEVRFDMIVDLGDGGCPGEEEQGEAAAGGGGSVGADSSAAAAVDVAGNIDVGNKAVGASGGNVRDGSGSGSAVVGCDGVGDSGIIDVSGAGSAAVGDGCENVPGGSGGGSGGNGSSSQGGLQSIAPKRVRLSLDDLL